MYVCSPAHGPLRQSEIVSNIVQFALTLDSVGTDKPMVLPQNHLLAIIASQDCDLEQDFNIREAGRPSPLSSILFYQVDEMLTMTRGIGSDIRKRIVANKD